MIRTGTAATPADYDLAEGIIWDDRAGVVRWVDIRTGRVLAGDIVDGQLVTRESVTVDQFVGAVAMAEDGGLLVAATRRLATISPTGAVSLGPDLLGDRENVRFNDGSADPFGSFIVGTLTIDGDRGDEVLLRIAPNGAVETLRRGIRLSNGIGFSPDGTTIYHIDTFAKTVSSHSYGSGPFDTDEPWVTVLDSDDLPEYPDGMVVDSEGMLWIAQFGGASVRRHSPTGELLEVVKVDATQVTCPGFVGENRDLLAITTGHLGESFGDQTGAIFFAEPGVTGLAEHRWAGSTTAPYWLSPEADRA